MTAVDVLSDIPDHVSADRVYDFDVTHDPILKPNPHMGVLELRKKAPEIFYTPRNNGHWVVMSHQAAFDITHDPGTFSSENKSEIQMLPIHSDAPAHTGYRHALLRIFAPKAASALIPQITDMAIELIDKVAPTGHCEFVADVSEPLPVIVFMKMLGLPLDIMVPLRKLVIAAINLADPRDRIPNLNEQIAMLKPTLDARYAKREDDMLSRIIDADVGGRKPTRDEVNSFLLLMANAGLDTVVNAMSYAAYHLAVDQEMQAKVRANPELIPELVEETFRRYSVSSVLRIVKHDTEFRGVKLKKGERMHVLLPAANLDPAVYLNPEEIILDREEPPVTFGTGVHRCLGSHLARLELKIVLTELLKRIPRFEIDPKSGAEMHAGMVYTIDKLPLVWKP